jgi:hypothetical protein
VQKLPQNQQKSQELTASCAQNQTKIFMFGLYHLNSVTFKNKLFELELIETNICVVMKWKLLI